MPTISAITVGNAAEPIEGRSGDLWWRWKVCVDLRNLSPALANAVTSVTMEVHPTFRRRRHQLAEAIGSPGVYESVAFDGWGTFEVPIEIAFDGDGSCNRKLSVKHELCFDNGGAKQEIPVDEGLLQLPTSGHNATCPQGLSSRNCCERKTVQDILQRQPFVRSHTDPAFWHGRLFSSDSVLSSLRRLPVITWESKSKPRTDGHSDGAPAWLTASEYEDDPEMLQVKLERLADLLRMSKKTVVYSGAGISTAAGIAQAAVGRKAANKGGNRWTMAQPTLTHYVLTALYDAGYVHGWVQQNHDGLPQKAGFPQERINEVHGSWYDPSNPVVKYDGSLRDDEFRWMERDAHTADLVLAVGTSLSGLSADKVVTKAAERSLLTSHLVDGSVRCPRCPPSLGMVMINLQRTVHDGKATLRLFGTTDNVFRALLPVLGNVQLPPVLEPAIWTGGERRVLVPYDANGRRLSESKDGSGSKSSTGGKMMWWDLRPGAKIRLSPFHNIHGSMQSAYQNISLENAGHIVGYKSSTVGIDLTIIDDNGNGIGFTLGQWWLEAARRGGPSTLPVVNLNPEFDYQ